MTFGQLNLRLITIIADQELSAPTEASLHEILDDVSRTPGGVSFVDASSFNRRHVNNIADALRYVPGVWAVSGTGTDSNFISIRGSNLDDKTFDLNGVKVLQDGLPITAADGIPRPSSKSACYQPHGGVSRCECYRIWR